MGTSQLDTVLAYDKVVKELVGIAASKYAEVKRHYPQLDIRVEEKLIGCVMTVAFKKSWFAEIGANGLEKDAVIEKIVCIQSPSDYHPLFHEPTEQSEPLESGGTVTEVLKRRRLCERESFASSAGKLLE